MYRTCRCVIKYVQEPETKVLYLLFSDSQILFWITLLLKSYIANKELCISQVMNMSWTILKFSGIVTQIIHSILSWPTVLNWRALTLNLSCGGWYWHSILMITWTEFLTFVKKPRDLQFYQNVRTELNVLNLWKEYLLVFTENWLEFRHPIFYECFDFCF